MLVDAVKDQWICSCGNWVDHSFEWCPDCCEDKFDYLYNDWRQKETVANL